MTTKQYLGNAQLKAAGVALQFTKDQIEEFTSSNHIVKS